MKDLGGNVGKDNKQPLAPASPNPKNVEVSTKNIYASMGDITQHFFKVDKLFDGVVMKGGGRQCTSFQMDQVQTPKLYQTLLNFSESQHQLLYPCCKILQF